MMRMLQEDNEACTLGRGYGRITWVWLIRQINKHGKFPTFQCSSDNPFLLPPQSHQNEVYPSLGPATDPHN